MFEEVRTAGSRILLRKTLHFVPRRDSHAVRTASSRILLRKTLHFVPRRDSHAVRTHINKFERAGVFCKRMADGGGYKAVVGNKRFESWEYMRRFSIFVVNQKNAWFLATRIFDGF